MRKSSCGPKYMRRPTPWSREPPPDEKRDLDKIFSTYRALLTSYRLDDMTDSVEVWNDEINRGAEASYRTHLGDPDWDFLAEYCALPYWSRAWIIPEIKLATRIRLLYGAQELLGDMFLALLDSVTRAAYRGTTTSCHLVNKSLPAQFWGDRQMWEPVKANKQGGRDPSLHFRDLIWPHALCSIPQDRVYSQRGLSSNGRELLVDYRDSPTDLFLRVMILEFQWDFFQSRALMDFSRTMVQALELQSEAVYTMDKSIRRLGLTERPSFLVEIGKDDRPADATVLVVHDWENATEAAVAVLRELECSDGGSEESHDLDWPLDMIEAERRERSERGRKVMIEILGILYSLDVGKFLGEVHPSTLAISNQGGGSIVTEAAGLSKKLQNGGERFILDSQGRIGRASADAVPGDLVCSVDQGRTNLILRRAPSQTYFLVTGWAVLPETRGCFVGGGHMETLLALIGDRMELLVHFDAVDVLRLGLWEQHLRERIDDYGKVRDPAFPVAELEQRLVRTGWRRKRVNSTSPDGSYVPRPGLRQTTTASWEQQQDISTRLAQSAVHLVHRQGESRIRPHVTRRTAAGEIADGSTLLAPTIRRIR